MTFKRIRVPAEQQVDVAALLASSGANWREAVKRYVRDGARRRSARSSFSDSFRCTSDLLCRIAHQG
jgi:hypothetical protein